MELIDDPPEAGHPPPFSLLRLPSTLATLRAHVADHSASKVVHYPRHVDHVDKHVLHKEQDLRDRLRGVRWPQPQNLEAGRNRYQHARGLAANAWLRRASTDIGLSTLPLASARKLSS